MRRPCEWAERYIMQYRHILTRQQLKTLIGQVKAGDPDGAIRGLNTIKQKTK